MRRVFLVLVISLVGTMVLAACGGAKATPAPAAALAEQSVVQAKTGERVFVIDSSQTEARYEVKESFFGEAFARIQKKDGDIIAIGRTKGVSGSFAFKMDGSSVELGDSNFRVDVKALASDDNRRDEQIRKRYLESNSFPIAEFVATEIQDFPDGFSEGQPVTFKLVGDLTIHGVTKPATFDVTATLDGDTLSGTATTLVFAKDFGFDAPNVANILKVEDGFTIVIDFVAKEK